MGNFDGLLTVRAPPREFNGRPLELCGAESVESDVTDDLMSMIKDLLLGVGERTISGDTPRVRELQPHDDVNFFPAKTVGQGSVIFSLRVGDDKPCRPSGKQLGPGAGVDVHIDLCHAEHVRGDLPDPKSVVQERIEHQLEALAVGRQVVDFVPIIALVHGKLNAASVMTDTPDEVLMIKPDTFDNHVLFVDTRVLEKVRFSEHTGISATRGKLNAAGVSIDAFGKLWEINLAIFVDVLPSANTCEFEMTCLFEHAAIPVTGGDLSAADVWIGAIDAAWIKDLITSVDAPPFTDTCEFEMDCLLEQAVILVELVSPTEVHSCDESIGGGMQADEGIQSDVVMARPQTFSAVCSDHVGLSPDIARTAFRATAGLAPEGCMSPTSAIAIMTHVGICKATGLAVGNVSITPFLEVVAASATMSPAVLRLSAMSVVIDVPDAVQMINFGTSIVWHYPSICVSPRSITSSSTQRAWWRWCCP